MMDAKPLYTYELRNIYIERIKPKPKDDSKKESK
jgi:hypothetical protein